ncbi:MAG: glycosyltransferase [Wenzhouxiangella sp.]|jgi:glycosyltransferase involved in cell wall biosynthesis|nr:glycosyltransferase [Wenzhouxiangella sp.]
MRQTPKVTVFIPVFNREDYVCTAINSVLAQQYTDFEILVVDDGSTDQTVERIAAYADSRVRLERNPSNLGIPATRNRGLELARGDYMALLDSDDYAYPDRLGRQVEFLDRHPDVVQVGSGCTLMDAKGQRLPRIRRHPLKPEAVDAHLLFHCSLINRTIMARTAVLRDFGYDEAFPRCQDYHLHLRLARTHRMANLPHLLVCGREHPGRITKNTAGLGRDRKMAIQGEGLADLGIDYSERDLAWHYQLTQKRDPAIVDAAEYLDWAEQWLNRLASANGRLQRYEQRAFRRVLGAMWTVACWHFRGQAGSRFPARLLSSRLSFGIPGNFNPTMLAGLAMHRPRPVHLDTSVPNRVQASEI